MKIKTIGVLLVAGLVVLAAMIVFAGTASACQVLKFNGTITDANGDPYVGHTVEIKKKAGGVWRSMGTNVTNSDGFYEIGYDFGTVVFYKKDTYRMFIDGTQVDERYINNWTYDGKICWNGKICCFKKWSYRWDYQIPEFATIAIPAVAVLGLFLFYSHRKRKEE